MNIELNPNSYLQWIKYAIMVGIYACIVTLIINVLFDRDTSIGVINRLTRMVKR